MIRRLFFSGKDRVTEPLWMRILLLFCILMGAPGSVLSATYQGTPANYQSLLNGLQAGDTLVLAPGTYPNGLSIIGMHGTAAQPIVITGPESGAPAVFTGRSCCNTVQIRDSSHVEIRHLKLDGLGIDGIDGVNGRGVTHHVTISGLHIVGHGGGQQTNGISTKGPAWDWVIRDNVIEGAGTGMYLGNSDGNQPFVNGVIERNLIVGTIGYNMQIKHQNPRPTGIGMPTGDSRTILRHNVFSKSGNSSTGGLARPNLLVGHFPLSGAGANDVYEIYGNFFYQNPTEALFQGEGNIAMYSNLFVNDHGPAVHVQPHNDVPRRVLIFRNTVVASTTGIRISGGASGFERRVFANAVFAGTPINAAGSSDNVTGARASASSHLRAPFAAPGALDLFPVSGALTGTAVDLGAVQAFTDGGLDFDTRSFPATGRGAYAGDAGSPSWLPQLQLKPLPGALPVLSFSASATAVQGGQGTQLTWGAAGADSCVAGGAWSGSRPLSGSQDTGPLLETSTFTLACTGAAGTTSRSVTVSVGNDPGDAGGGFPVGGDASALIEGLRTQDGSNASAWAVRTGFQSGVQLHGDRPYVAVTVPDAVTGADWIQTANDSRDFNGQALASFMTGAQAEVFVGHRDDIGAKPSWLSQWADTGLQLINDEPRSYTLYRKTFNANETVVLGPNGSSASGMYIVLVRAAGGPVTPPVTYQPDLPPQPGQPVGEALLQGAPYMDPNGGSLAAARWEIVQDGNDRMVYGRRITSGADLRIPLGILVAGETYRARVRHESSLGLLSSWSEYRSFEAESWHDGDGDGTHDLYQGDPQDGDDRCQLRHPQGGSVDALGLTAGVRIHCLAITEPGDLALSNGFLDEEGAPYGFLGFRIEGLAVVPGNPAEVSLMLFLPAGLGSGSRWYEYDRAEGRLTDASVRAGGLTPTSTQVTIALVDGGPGDADGVVNGLIVVQGGIITAEAAQQLGSGTGPGDGAATDDGGAGSLALADILLGFLLTCFLWTIRRQGRFHPGHY